MMIWNRINTGLIVLLNSEFKKKANIGVQMEAINDLE